VAEKDFVAVLAERDTEGVAGMLSVIDRVALSVSAMDIVVVVVWDVDWGRDSENEIDSEVEILSETVLVEVAPEMVSEVVSGIDAVIDKLSVSVMGSDSVVVRERVEVRVAVGPELDTVVEKERERVVDVVWDVLPESVSVSVSLTDNDILIVLVRWHRGPAHPSLQLHTQSG
jgi:hypothetical protein